jgi:hypothetical protein
VNGSWWEAIAKSYSPPLSTVNGTYIQAIAEELGATGTVNGTWIEAIYDRITSDPLLGVTIIIDNGTTTNVITDNGTTTNIITDNGSQN